MIKCPENMNCVSANNKRAKGILKHLDKALEIDYFNKAALYDKGLTLRMIKHHTGAIDVFKRLIDNETSLMHLANMYEQLGFCLRDKLVTNITDEETRERMIFDMKHVFMKSVVLSAQLAKTFLVYQTFGIREQH